MAGFGLVLKLCDGATDFKVCPRTFKIPFKVCPTHLLQAFASFEVFNNFNVIKCHI